MAESIVRIQRELEEAQAQIAVYEAERSILLRERDKTMEEVVRLRGALQRLADCNWVITPHDRMDAVRKIARDALEASK